MKVRRPKPRRPPHVFTSSPPPPDEFDQPFEPFENFSRMFEEDIRQSRADHAAGRVARSIGESLGFLILRLLDSPRPASTIPPTRAQTMPHADARTILGLPPAPAPLTAAQVKERHRALALLFHSDTGGNDEAMRRANLARDALLRELGAKR